MQNNKLVGVLFGMNGKSHVTLVDSRSRNRFKRLIGNWAVDGELIDSPKEEQNFVYIDLNIVLSDIEQTYKDLQNTPAVARVATNVFKLINTIKAQNEIDFDDSLVEEDDEDKEDE
ncbi:hypothetical protein D3C75_623090 [compost metagenome]